ncbi:Aldo/keto reductase [Annulohypoxylon nitens]|nr:Aldo/keto reductase [Annulohypoxylon nitens]
MSTPPNKQYIILANGVRTPVLGFGTFANEGSKGETFKAVTKALEVGYRHLDCAWFYKNEAEVGEALRAFLEKNPSVKREDIFITTKVWPHLMEPEDVKWSLENSLQNFGLDYIDLFLLHWPFAAESDANHLPKIGPDGKYIIKKGLTENLEPTWRAVEELYESKKTRAIGTSNWTIAGLKQLLGYAKVKPVVNQVEIHPFLPNQELLDFCFLNHIICAAYSPLGSQDQVPNTGEKVRTNKTLNEVADRSGRTLAQILLAWGIRRGYVVLPKSSTPSRIESNFDVPRISDADFEAVNSVAKGRHTRFVNMKDTFGYDVWPEEAKVDGVSV